MVRLSPAQNVIYFLIEFIFAEKEIEIVYDLAQKVLQYENVLVEASDICGEIDWFVSQIGTQR